MNINQIIKDIIYLPKKSKTLGNISMYDLLKTTNYFRFYNKVSIQDIINALNKHNNVINDWILYSENKRSSSGWYFKYENEKYIVGYIEYKSDSMEYKDNPTKYKNQTEACANFIKNEIENIRCS